MAFSNTVKKREDVAGGYSVEEGTWDGAAVTTGTITASSVDGVSDISEITEFSFTSDNDTDVIVGTGANPNQIDITFTINDTGKYTIKGKGV